MAGKLGVDYSANSGASVVRQRFFNEPTLEYVAEMSRETILHFGHVDGPAEQSSQ